MTPRFPGDGDDTRSRLIRHVAACVGCTVVVLTAIRLAGGIPRVEFFVAVAVVVAVASLALRELAEGTPDTSWPLFRRARPPEQRTDSRVTTLETILRRSLADSTQFTSRLQPLLAELASQRLRRTRGIDPDWQPEEARAVLGDDVFDLLTAPPVGPIDPQRIAGAVDAIERL
jgi:hypothetical protein